MGADKDPWKHRSEGMKCKTCMWFCPKEKRSDPAGSEQAAIDLGRCRKHAPTMSGYPVVFVNGWCGDHEMKGVVMIGDGITVKVPLNEMRETALPYSLISGYLREAGIPVEEVQFIGGDIDIKVTHGRVAKDCLPGDPFNIYFHWEP